MSNAKKLKRILEKEFGIISYRELELAIQEMEKPNLGLFQHDLRKEIHEKKYDNSGVYRTKNGNLHQV